MSTAEPTEPDELVAAIQANRPVTTPDEAVRQRNLVQQLLSTLDPGTPFEQAILEAVNDLVDVVGDVDEPQTVAALLRRQVRGQMDTTRLPIGQFGQAAETITSNKQGTGFFETWAGKFATEVTAAENISKEDPIVVVRQPGNIVRQESSLGTVAGVTEETEIPRVGPQAVINVANQIWVNGDPALEPTVTTPTFDGDLAAGDEEVVCQVESTVEEVSLDGVRVGVTSHEANLDNDASTPDQSVVRYHFEYKNLAGVTALSDAVWTEFPWSPTVLPRGDLAAPVSLLDDHVVGPVYGLRIRFENRSDEGSLVSTLVSEEDIGGLIMARAVV